jgi:hypothetical protein
LLFKLGALFRGPGDTGTIARVWVTDLKGIVGWPL